MNLAEARLGGIRGARVGGAIGDVEFERQHALEITELRRRGGEMIVANIRDDHIHTRAEQRFGDAESDSAGAPGHECGFAWQVLHRGSPPRLMLRRRGPTKRWTNRRESYCI